MARSIAVPKTSVSPVATMSMPVGGAGKQWIVDMLCHSIDNDSCTSGGWLCVGDGSAAFRVHRWTPCAAVPVVTC